MNEYINKFIEWTKLKIRIHLSEDIKFYFRERQIWWVSLGENIGFEQSGKNKGFERPVLVLKKFNKYLFGAIPLTSQLKTGKYYYQYQWSGNKYSALLSQLKTLSSKRLIRKMGEMHLSDFMAIKNKVKNLL